MLNQLSARLEKMQWGTAAPGEGMGETPSRLLQEARQEHQTWMPWRPPVALRVEARVKPCRQKAYPRQSRRLTWICRSAIRKIALETLGCIFEAIFETWDLPDTVKTAIGRLQIPLLKLSLFDQALFSNNQHPARQLINAMGRAAIGLPRDISRADPVSRRLWKIAGLVQETLQGDASVLSEPLEQIQTLIAERDTVIREMGAPFVTYLQRSTSRRLAQNPSSVGWPTFPATERTGNS